MHNKKTFIMGLFSGLAIMAAAALAFNYVTDRVRWGDRIAPDDKVDAIYDMLEAHSINEYDRDKLMEDMYRGLLNGVGDPYTYYFDKDAYDSFTVRTEGIYVGVGIVLTVSPDDRAVTIVSVYPGTPAEDAGLLPGDKIMEINGTVLTDKTFEETVAMLKGREGTSVKLAVARSGVEDFIAIEISRRNISIPTVSHKMLEGVIGYIRIDQFDRVTLAQFTEALTDLQEQQMRGLIIDLRDNPGGLLNTVTDIADILLPEGVVTYTENKNGEKKYYNSSESELDLPMVLLVNGNSASASEVLCGAVKDMGKGVLVGERTFGKGIVQNLYELQDGSAIKVTVAKYYTPNGICIQGEGIAPDHTVTMDAGGQWVGSLEEAEDAQLQKAIAVMWSEMASLN